MLPQSHITYTFVAWETLKSRFPSLPKVDYRILALAAMGPDLIDKPFAALYFYKKYKSAVGQLLLAKILLYLGQVQVWE